MARSCLSSIPANVRGLLATAVAACLLSLSGAEECSGESGLPCSYGACVFSKDASGHLFRTGDCVSQTGALDLSNKGIKTIASDAFEGLGMR